MGGKPLTPLGQVLAQVVIGGDATTGCCGKKVVLAPESMPLENVRDNVALLNGMDLSSVLENMNIEKVYLATDNSTATGEPVKVKTTFLKKLI